VSGSFSEQISATLIAIAVRIFCRGFRYVTAVSYQ